MIRIGHIELFVRNPLISQRFYEQTLGFKLITIQGDNIWLSLGNREILLRRGDPPPADATYRDARSALVLYTNDLPATTQELRERGLVFSGKDGSAKCPTFQDPDGHWFQLVNPLDH